MQENEVPLETWVVDVLIATSKAADEINFHFFTNFYQQDQEALRSTEGCPRRLRARLGTDQFHV